MNWIASEEYLALFFEVDDKDLKLIQANRDYFRDENFIRRIQSENGNNAHAYGLVIRGGSPSIRCWIGRLLERYDSVSWWTVKHRKFFIRRRKT